MDTQRIYRGIRAKSNLENCILEDFVLQYDEFFRDLAVDIERISAYEAVEVLSLLIYSERYFVSRSKWEQMIYQCLEKVRSGIYTGELLSASVFGGLSHVIFVVKELADQVNGLYNFTSSLDNLLERIIPPYIDIKNPKFNIQNNYELISGLSGILRCCIDGDLTEQFQSLSFDTINAIITRLTPRKYLGYSIPGFHYYPSELEQKFISNLSSNGYLNYGVSHGVAGPLCALSLAMMHGISHNQIEETIRDLIEELLKARFYVDNILYWPGRISFEQYIGQDIIEQVTNRMSWCYGSPGILRALYIAAEALGESSLKGHIVLEIEKIAELDTDLYLLNTPIVCHGLAGMTLIMMRMYKDTQNDIFMEKQCQLADNLIHNFAYRDAENNHLTGMEAVKKYSYLEGYSGILQTIYSFIDDNTANVNEKMLLLL